MRVWGMWGMWGECMENIRQCESYKRLCVCVCCVCVCEYVCAYVWSQVRACHCVCCWVSNMKHYHHHKHTNKKPNKHKRTRVKQQHKTQQRKKKVFKTLKVLCDECLSKEFREDGKYVCETGNGRKILCREYKTNNRTCTTTNLLKRKHKKLLEWLNWRVFIKFEMKIYICSWNDASNAWGAQRTVWGHLMKGCSIGSISKQHNNNITHKCSNVKYCVFVSQVNWDD